MRFFSKYRLQSSETVIYYISVAPLEGGCSEADINTDVSADRLKKFEKSFKNDLQNKKSVIYYVSVARRKRRCSEADINTGKFCGSQFETFGFEKNRKNSEK